MSHHTEKINDRIQEGNWEKEKHVPVIQCEERIKAGAWTPVTITLGKAVAHPNTTEHHIRWIKASFSPDDDKFAYDLGRFEFNAHGEAAKGPNQGPVHTHHEVSFTFKTQASGTLHALSYCNIHGLWEFDRRIEAE